MRSCWIYSIALTLVAAWPAHAAPRRKPVDPAVAANAASVEGTIKEIFSRADTNHNDALSKVEFRKAQGMLEPAAMDLARQGVLGNPPKKQNGKQAKSSWTAPSAGSIDLSKNNKITLAEFTLFAQSYFQNADAVVTQARKAQEAQQRARSAPNRARNNQRR
jgi:hypothetical protein